MLTPVDLQQKKFTHGMGYARKDVDAFFDIVVLSYTELYKSNADLTNQVKTLTDSLVHYRTTESKLQKSLMLAEKNAEESTKNATDKARLIENDAKIKANNIVQEAREELERIEGSAQNPINEEMGLNFDDVLSEGSSNASYSQSTQSAAMNSFMNSYDGDPQGREESTLGSGGGSAMGDSTLGGAGGGSVTSDSSVYTKNLGGKSFVNPFGN